MTEPVPIKASILEDIQALYDYGARFVLCGQNKAPIHAKGYLDLPRPTPSEVIAHTSLIGIVPATIGCLVIDVDLGDIHAIERRYGAPLVKYPTRKKEGVHFHYFSEIQYTNKPLSGLPHIDSGDLRSSSGYAILWDHRRTIPKLAKNHAQYRDTERYRILPTFLSDLENQSLLRTSLDWSEGSRNNSLFAASFAALINGAHVNDLTWLRQKASESGLEDSEIEATILGANRAAQNRGIIDDMAEIEESFVAPIDDYAITSFEERISKTYTRAYENTRLYHEERRQWYALDSTTGQWSTQLAASLVYQEITRIAYSIIGSTLDPRLKNSYASKLKYATLNGIRNDLAEKLSSAPRFDQCPFLLGTKSGVIDLRTGAIRPASPEEYVSLSVGDYDPQPGEYPIADNIVSHAAGGDAGVEAWIWRFMGYSLTGYNREEIMLFAYGAPGTGKSTLVNMIRQVLGEYGSTVSSKRLMASRYDQHLQWLAQLESKRFVVASESSGNRSWNTEIINDLISGSEIEANKMRENSSTYTSQVKLAFTANNPPSFPQGDGISRRMRVLQMNQVPEEPDDTLRDKIQGELPQILDRMITEAGQWLRVGGLSLEQTPQSILQDTKEYLQTQDTIALFIEDQICREEDSKIEFSKLYQVYESWCRDHDEISIDKILSKIQFKRYLVGQEIYGSKIKFSPRRNDRNITVLHALDIAFIDNNSQEEQDYEDDPF